MVVNCQLHVPAALLTGKEYPIASEQEAGWAQNRSGRGGEKKKSHK